MKVQFPCGRRDRPRRVSTKNELKENVAEVIGDAQRTVSTKNELKVSGGNDIGGGAVLVSTKNELKVNFRCVRLLVVDGYVEVLCYVVYACVSCWRCKGAKY